MWPFYSEGYCYTFSLHCGKETTATDWPLGSHVVLNAVQYLADPTGMSSILVTSLQTWMDLLSQLADSGFWVTATIKTVSQWKITCPLKSSKEMKKSVVETLSMSTSKSQRYFLWYGTTTLGTFAPHHNLRSFMMSSKQWKARKTKACCKA